MSAAILRRLRESSPFWQKFGPRVMVASLVAALVRNDLVLIVVSLALLALSTLTEVVCDS